MFKILDTIYSVAFFWGAFVGTVFWKLYCHSRARLLDIQEPLPDGRKHAASRMSRVWVAGLCMVLSVGYVLLAATKAESRTSTLSEDVTHCWQETYQQIRAQVQINKQNDDITRKVQALQREYDEDTSDWLKSLVNPPGDLATQPTNSPARQAWGLRVSMEYQAKLDDLGRRSDQANKDRDKLDVERAQHPLPEARCGKTQ